MSYRTYILLLGIWTIVVPFLGIPMSWKKIFLVAGGLGIIWISILVGQRKKKHTPHLDQETEHASFIENTESESAKDESDTMIEVEPEGELVTVSEEEIPVTVRKTKKVIRKTTSAARPKKRIVRTVKKKVVSPVADATSIEN